VVRASVKPSFSVLFHVDSQCHGLDAEFFEGTCHHVKLFGLHLAETE